MMITNLTDDNKVQYVNGIMYVRVGNNFTDSINVYDGKNVEQKLGVINFMVKGKAIVNKRTGMMFMVDGFVFEPQSNVQIDCTTFKHIARYVYDLNEQFKEYARLKQGGNND